MNKQDQLKDIHLSGKPYAIYKSINGFDLYADFSKKIILNNKNVYSFLNKRRAGKKFKETDLFIGFFGYELLNNLIGIKIPKQKSINFPKGIFYKPEKKISYNKRLILHSKIKKLADVGIGIVMPDEIDKIGITKATNLAAKKSMFKTLLFKKTLIDGYIKIKTKNVKEIIILLYFYLLFHINLTWQELQ